MTRARKPALPAALAMAVALFACAEARGNSSAHLLLGQKHMSEDGFLVPETGTNLGALLSFAGADWPIHVAVDLLVMSADGRSRFGPDVDLDTLEAAVGVRKFWNVGQARTYVGGGLAFIRATYEERRDPPYGDPVRRAESDAYGPWVCSGVAWRLGRRFDLGFDVRWEIAGTDLEDLYNTPDNVDVGGFSYGLTFGYAW